MSKLAQVKNGKETVVGKDVFDTQANLRIYWNGPELSRRLNLLSPNATVTSELQTAAAITQVAREGIESSRSFVRVIENSSDSRAYANAVGEIGQGMMKAILLVRGKPGLYQRLQDAFTKNAINLTRVEERDRASVAKENQARGAAAVFNELLQIGNEMVAAATTKLSASGAHVWVITTTNRDNDPTRRREVAFLSELTDEDKAALSAIADYAKDFGNTPSALVKSQVKNAEEAAQKALTQAKTAFDAKLTSINAQWTTLYNKYKDDATYKTDVQAIEAKVGKLKDSLTESIDALKTEAGKIPQGTPTDKADAMQRLNTALNILADVKAVVAGFGQLPSQLEAVEKDINALITKMGSNVDQAVKDFNQLLDDTHSEINDLVVQIEGIGKGGISTLLDALGLGSKMEQIAQTVTSADPSKASVDIDMGHGSDSPLHLLSGDQVVINVKLGTGETPPEKTEESHKLYAYADEWTSDRIIPITFAPRTDKDPSTGNRRESWKFTPTYMDVFKRYSMGRSAESNKWLTPGFGIAISALDQNGDDSYELGIGAGLTLLDDRLIGGIGFNVQRNQSYAFFGIRLRLGDFGIRG